MYLRLVLHKLLKVHFLFRHPVIVCIQDLDTFTRLISNVIKFLWKLPAHPLFGAQLRSYSLLMALGLLNWLYFVPGIQFAKAFNVHAMLEKVSGTPLYVLNYVSYFGCLVGLWRSLLTSYWLMTDFEWVQTLIGITDDYHFYENYWLPHGDLKKFFDRA